MGTTFVRFACALGFVLAGITLSSHAVQDAQEQASYRQISIESYADKVAGGWLGQAIGVLLGEPTEFKWALPV